MMTIFVQCLCVDVSNVVVGFDLLDDQLVACHFLLEPKQTTSDMSKPSSSKLSWQHSNCWVICMKCQCFNLIIAKKTDDMSEKESITNTASCSIPFSFSATQCYALLCSTCWPNYITIEDMYGWWSGTVWPIWIWKRLNHIHVAFCFHFPQTCLKRHALARSFHPQSKMFTVFGICT